MELVGSVKWISGQTQLRDENGYELQIFWGLSIRKKLKLKPNYCSIWFRLLIGSGARPADPIPINNNGLGQVQLTHSSFEKISKYKSFRINRFWNGKQRVEMWGAWGQITDFEIITRTLIEIGSKTEIETFTFFTFEIGTTNPILSRNHNRFRNQVWCGIETNPFAALV